MLGGLASSLQAHVKRTVSVGLLVIWSITLTACSDKTPPASEHDDFITELLACTRESSEQVSKDVPWFDPDTSIEQAQKGLVEIENRDISEECVEQAVQEYLASWMNHCTNNGCGEDIGGGCAHLSGLRAGIPRYSAMMYCSKQDGAAL